RGPSRWTRAPPRPGWDWRARHPGRAAPSSAAPGAPFLEYSVIWSQRPVRVRAPATSANLGPGFDAMGLALSLHDEVEARVTGGELVVEGAGEGAESVGLGEEHLGPPGMRGGAGGPGGRTPGPPPACA